MTPYIALIRKEPGSSFGVDFPDFPGCITAGETLGEAVRKAHEVLAFHVEGMQEDGEPLPEPSALEDVMADPESEGAMPAVVTLAVTRGKAVRINLTMDEGLLARIDAFTATRNTNRSAFLADAARRAMQAR